MSRETMLELRDALHSIGNAVELRLELEAPIDENLRAALLELTKALALELGLELVEKGR